MLLFAKLSGFLCKVLVDIYSAQIMHLKEKGDPHFLLIIREASGRSLHDNSCLSNSCVKLMHNRWRQC